MLNNPITYYDRDGHEPITIIIGVIAFVGVSIWALSTPSPVNAPSQEDVEQGNLRDAKVPEAIIFSDKMVSTYVTCRFSVYLIKKGVSQSVGIFVLSNCINPLLNGLKGVYKYYDTPDTCRSQAFDNKSVVANFATDFYDGMPTYFTNPFGSFLDVTTTHPEFPGILGTILDIGDMTSDYRIDEDGQCELINTDPQWMEGTIFKEVKDALVK